jgi:hypothetical protein
MKISAVIAVWLCAAFSLVCAGFAYTGFSALETLADEAERELSRGYAWFWVFLAVVGLGFGILSWMIKEGKLGDPDRM